MTDKLTRYTFRVKTDDVGGGPDGMDPSYRTWVKRFGADAQAELYAQQLSEDHGNCTVKISRADATWSVWSGHLPRVEG